MSGYESRNPNNPQLSDPDGRQAQVAGGRSYHDYEYASMLMCERCKVEVSPLEDTYPSWKTHVLAGLLFFIGLPFCVFLPYCFDCCGEDVLRCPKCGCYINIPHAQN